MTSPLLRSRPTTARVPSTSARTGASLVGLGLLLWGGLARAQEPTPLPSSRGVYLPLASVDKPPAAVAPVPAALAGLPNPAPAAGDSAPRWAPLNPPGVSAAATLPPGHGVMPSFLPDIPSESASIVPAAAVTGKEKKEQPKEPDAAKPILPTGRQAAMQRPTTPLPPPSREDTRGPSDDQPEYMIQPEPPGPERLFRLESELALQERMRQEARQRPMLERIAFPEEPVLSREAYTPRVFPPAKEIAEADYVCYDRLYFEQINLERYGWDLGFISPFVSAGTLFLDVVAPPSPIG